MSLSKAAAVMVRQVQFDTVLLGRSSTMMKRFDLHCVKQDMSHEMLVLSRERKSVSGKLGRNHSFLNDKLQALAFMPIFRRWLSTPETQNSFAKPKKNPVFEQQFRYEL